MTPHTLVVRATLAHLRREPSHASELVSQLVLGEEARVLETSGDWVRVAGDDGYAGWVHARSFAQGALAPAPGWIWSLRDGTLWEGPSARSAPLCDLVLGARVAPCPPGVEAAGRAGTDLMPVRLWDGTVAWGDRVGWVTAADLPWRFPPTPKALLGTALGLRGVPYLWGGASSKAFDCSGFVQRVFGLHGVRLPRDAHQQAEVGSFVESGPAGSGLRQADLIFFDEGGGRVSHVAIALGREGRLVHCSTGRAGVGVDSLNPADPLYAPKLAASIACCRRVI